jgi:hypothetical protein
LLGTPANDAVYCYKRDVQRKGLLETMHRCLRNRSEDSIHLRALARIPSKRLRNWNFLSYSPDRVAFASLLDLYDEGRPRRGCDDPVGCQPVACLKGFHPGFGVRTKHAIDRDAMPARPQQMLQRP